MIEWTKERIAEKSNDELESLRENAVKHGRKDIAELCSEELTRRKPVRVRKALQQLSEDHRGQYVSEFHFVCPSELGITRDHEGTIRTGTWVVAEKHAEDALKYGAVVALHASKAEPSYLQGTIKDWRKGSREPKYSGEQRTQTEEGIDFFFEPTDSPLVWKGEGSGEKGYAWSDIPE